MNSDLICDNVAVHLSTRLLVTFFCCRICRKLVGCRIDLKTRYCKTCDRDVCPDIALGDVRVEHGIAFSCCLMPDQ